MLCARRRPTTPARLLEGGDVAAASDGQANSPQGSTGVNMSRRSGRAKKWAARFTPVALARQAISVAGYDGVHLIYEALKKTNGSTNGSKLVEATKGLEWESPRGPMSVDLETRDVVQNFYLCSVEKIDGKLYNSEFVTFQPAKNPIKETKRFARRSTA